jgi:hypothetical protein
MLVELTTERPGAAIEHGNAHAELRDVVCGLEAEEPGADHDRALAPTGADVLLDLDGVVDRAEREAPRDPEAFDRRDEGARPGCEDEPVVGEALPGLGFDLTASTVDGHDRDASPIVDAPRLRPVAPVEVQAVDRDRL